MTDEQKEKLAGLVDCEGFDYAFRQYSDFKDIKDPSFHRLIERYRDISDAQEEYIELDKYTECG